MRVCGANTARSTSDTQRSSVRRPRRDPGGGRKRGFAILIGFSSPGTMLDIVLPLEMRHVTVAWAGFDREPVWAPRSRQTGIFRSRRPCFRNALAYLSANREPAARGEPVPAACRRVALASMRVCRARCSAGRVKRGAKSVSRLCATLARLVEIAAVTPNSDDAQGVAVQRT